VLAPKGTPADVVERLNQAINQVLKMPAVGKAFEAQGMIPATSSPAEFGALIAKDAQRWADVVKRSNITAD
ncbi:MAG: tripartite tricarboxylate transporter substrate binding protein, partial [Ottowia sp.]|nr:tripartite tricarboxylate transporter substrate binding protein [Ottowia sp.]